MVPFLLKGIVRGFLFDVNGQEITDCFAVQPGIPVMTSADLRAPSPLSMDAMVPSEFLTIPIPEVQRLLERYPALQQLYHRLLIESFSMHWEMKLTLCRDTAMQKYQWFLRKYPGLVDQISSKYIARFGNDAGDAQQAPAGPAGKRESGSIKEGSSGALFFSENLLTIILG